MTSPTFTKEDEQDFKQTLHVSRALAPVGGAKVKYYGYKDSHRAIKIPKQTILDIKIILSHSRTNVF